MSDDSQLVTPEEAAAPIDPRVLAAQLLLRRRACRRSMTEWARECGFEPAAHHRLLIEELEKVVRGETKRLMICLPPGSAKSTYTSVLFPPWYLNQYPGGTILACSYSYTLAEGFGRRARNLVEQKHELLGVTLSPHTKAAGEWETLSGGRYFCAGVNAGIAGHRCDIGFIDDPIGSEEDADSKLYRDKQWEWSWNDFVPRLKPHGARIIIANRRHEDDLLGRLLATERDRWKLIRVPFFAEEDDVLDRAPGARLWPEWFTEEQAAEVRCMSPRTQSGLYQQNPTPESGNFFERSWLQGYMPADLPKELTIYVGSDHAISKEEEADKSCFIPVGVDKSGIIWVLPDVWWKKAGSDAQVNAMFALMQSREPLIWWAGKDHIEASLGPFLRHRMREEHVFVRIESVPPGRRDKRRRAHSIHGLMSMGMVRFPKWCPWWPDAERELLTFDAGTHDDFVDALAIIGQGIHKMHPAKAASLPLPAPPVAWRPTMRWIKRNVFRNDRAFALDL